MAEVLAVVASGISIVQIAGQLISCAQRLRTLCKKIHDIPVELETTMHEVEVLSQVLSHVEQLPDQEMDFLQASLKHCQAAAAALEGLIERASFRNGSGSKLRTLDRLTFVIMKKDEMKELKMRMDSAIRLLNLAVTCYTMTTTQRNLSMLNQLNTRLSTSTVPLSVSCNKTESKGLNPKRAKVSIQRQLQYSPGRRCGIKKCCCTCHETTLIRGGSWSLEIPMLSSLWSPCNRSSCANATSASIWVGLRRIGIPWAVCASLDIMWSSHQCYMTPSLTFQRVVGNDSPGFKYLRELRKGRVLDWEEAKGELQNLFDSGKASPRDVDPDGQTWIEKVIDCLWSRGNIDIQFEMIPFLAQLGTQMNTKGLLYSSAEWIGEGPHLVLIEDLISCGFDASEIEAPSFSAWPLPYFADIGSYSKPISDPFFVEWIAKNLKVCPGFAGINPLLEAILIESNDEVKRLLSKIPLTDNNNLLGQSALHLAVFRPQHLKVILESHADVNARDRHSMTPLMYAMATGNSPAAIHLLEADANPFLIDDFRQNAFSYTQSQGNWNTIMDIVSHFYNRRRDTDESIKVAQSWLTLGAFLSLPGDAFGRKLKAFETFLKWGANVNSIFFGSTLAHLAKNEDELKVMLSYGFSNFDHADKTGAHALISAAKLRSPRMIELLLEGSSSVNHQNFDGHTALHAAIQNGRDVSREYNGWEPDDCAGISDCMKLLLAKGADPLLCDKCQCACSRSGCTASTMLLKETEPSEWVRRPNDILARELLSSVKENKGSDTAKQCLLDMLRVLQFEKDDLTHTCCQQSEDYVYDKSMMRRLSDEDVGEIMHEESELIEALEQEMHHIEASLEDEIEAAIESSGIITQLKAKSRENTRTFGGLFEDAMKNLDLDEMIEFLDDLC